MTDLVVARSLLTDTHYEPIKILGSGADSTVFEAYDKNNNKHVAIKILTDVKDVDQNLVNDVDIAKNIICPEFTVLNRLNQSKIRDYVPELHEYFYIIYEDKLYAIIVEEFIEGVSLFKISMDWMNEGIDVQLLHYIVSTILYLTAYMSSKGIYHGDIHGYNVMWDGHRLRLIDFGRSVFSGIERICGEEFTYHADEKTESFYISQLILNSLNLDELVDESYNRNITSEELMMLLPPSEGDYDQDTLAAVLAKGINKDSNVYEMYFDYVS